MADEENQSSTSTGPRVQSGTTCEHCGTAIDTSDWYPVTNERDADGSIQLYDFCSEDCQDAWREERSD